MIIPSSCSIKSIPPGATIGILGSGQLGRMLAMAAKRLGYRIHIYAPEIDPPARTVCDRYFQGDYIDSQKLSDFSKSVDVITFEFENVPYPATKIAFEHTLVRPAGEILHTTQNRRREKEFLKAAEIPIAPFRCVESEEEFLIAVEEIGHPGVLKTEDFGYDGKGQKKILTKHPDELRTAWRQLGFEKAVYEKWIEFSKEISVVIARTTSGDTRSFPVFENLHTNHILDVTLAPARVSEELAARAISIAQRIVVKLDLIGLITVELFVTACGEILVNELAPRVHNSGHLTLDCCVTSQFEQQIRAICGLPLGDTDLLGPSAMVNLLGDLWAGGEPNWIATLEDPRIKLHLYGKNDARPGRKMGHITTLGITVDDARQRAIRAVQYLRPRT